MPRHQNRRPLAQPVPAPAAHTPATAGPSPEASALSACPFPSVRQSLSIRSIPPVSRRPPVRAPSPVPRFSRALPLLLGLAVLLPALLAGCGEKTPPGEAATMRACRICHGMDRICGDIGRLDRAGWEKTVDRMIAGGASVTPEERTAVIDWLATRKPGEAPLCP